MDRRLLFNDYQLSKVEEKTVSILSKLSRRLDNSGIVHILDANWPYHLITVPKYLSFSIYTGGLNSSIDIARLGKTGHVDKRRKEVTFLTPKGAINYIVKQYNKVK